MKTNFKLVFDGAIIDGSEIKKVEVEGTAEYTLNEIVEFGKQAKDLLPELKDFYIELYKQLNAESQRSEKVTASKAK